MGSCIEVTPTEVSFERVEAELAELAQLIEDGRPVEDIRLERQLDLATMCAQGGDLEHAIEIWDDVLTTIGSRPDREGLWLGARAWWQRGDAYVHRNELKLAVDAYSSSYGRIALAIARWPDAELSKSTAELLLALACNQDAIGQREAAVRAFETGIAVCARFPDTVWFVHQRARLELNRGNTLNAMGRKDDAIAAFERSLAGYGELGRTTYNGIASNWIGLGNARVDPIESRRAYEHAIELLAPYRTERDAAVLEAKTCFNIALGCEPAEALAWKSRAIDLLEEHAIPDAPDRDRYELLMYRIGRAELLAKLGMVTSAFEESSEVISELEAVAHRLDKSVAYYRNLHTRWSHQASSRCPLVYRSSKLPVTAGDELRCSACARPRSWVPLMIRGTRGQLCSDCLVGLVAAADPHGPRCMFCDDDRPGAVIGGAAICDACAADCGAMYERQLAAGKVLFRCTFCHRPRSECMQLVSGPRVYICNSCIAAATTALPPETLDAGPPAQCRFCGLERQRFVGTADGVICDDCLALCNDILEEKMAESHPDPRCGVCSATRATAERLLLGPEATALCRACWATGPRSVGGPCTWCAAEARPALHRAGFAVCDGCLELAALDLS